MLGSAMESAIMVLGVAILALAASLGSTAIPSSDRRRLARLEGKVDLLLRNAGLAYDPLASAPAGVVEALRQRQMAEAIKRYREATGADLADAKAGVEELQARLNA